MFNIEYKEITVEDKLFYEFVFENKKLFTTIENKTLLVNIDFIKSIDPEIINLIIQKKYKILSNKYKFVNSDLFLQLISWVCPNDYHLYKNFIFYVNLYLSLNKLKNLNYLLKNKQIEITSKIDISICKS